MVYDKYKYKLTTWQKSIISQGKKPRYDHKTRFFDVPYERLISNKNKNIIVKSKHEQWIR
jgi:hypothetical protein